MSIAELKEKIIVEVNLLTDEKTLQQVLDILDKQEEKSSSINAMKHADLLFKKHDGLLKRLS